MAAPGIYLHTPFCSAICPYCDFAVTVGGAGKRRRFADAVVAEIEIAAADPWRGAAVTGPADTLYLGGGTPSLLEPGEMAAILGTLGARLAVAPRPWLAIEANPEDVSSESCAAWRRLGVAFLSLGVQSFEDERLALLGRRHTAAQARDAVAVALAAGFETVSLDLIYGLPGQSPQEWRVQLETALALAPQHLSCYQLTVEPGTPFAVMRRRGRLRELPEPRQAALFRLTHELLADHGYPAYEVSNFAAAPQHRSRHNAKHWRHVPYLGLGPSAHSFDGCRRWWNERRLEPWAEAVAAGRRPLGGEEPLSAGQLALEELMLALRTPEGLDLAGFRRRHGIDLVAANAEAIERLAAGRLIDRSADRLRPTVAGLAVAEGIAGSLRLPPPTGRLAHRLAS